MPTAKLFQASGTVEEIDNLMGLLHLLSLSVGMVESRERMKLITQSEAGFVDRATAGGNPAGSRCTAPTPCGFKMHFHVHCLDLFFAVTLQEERTLAFMSR